MVQGIGGINNSPIVSYNLASKAVKTTSAYDTQESLNSFDNEDTAIISAQANLLNELDKYNSGAGNDVELALTSVNSKNQVEANVAVINAKKDMLDSVMKIAE